MIPVNVGQRTTRAVVASEAAFSLVWNAQVATGGGNVNSLLYTWGKEHLSCGCHPLRSRREVLMAVSRGGKVILSNARD